MSRPKLTPWFDGEVKPIWPGVYKRRIGIVVFYAKWTGKAWLCGALNIDAALMERKASRLPPLPWRGMAQDHSVADKRHGKVLRDGSA